MSKTVVIVRDSSGRIKSYIDDRGQQRSGAPHVTLVGNPNKGGGVYEQGGRRVGDYSYSQSTPVQTEMPKNITPPIVSAPAGQSFVTPTTMQLASISGGVSQSARERNLMASQGAIPARQALLRSTRTDFANASPFIQQGRPSNTYTEAPQPQALRGNNPFDLASKPNQQVGNALDRYAARLQYGVEKSQAQGDVIKGSTLAIGSAAFGVGKGIFYDIPQLVLEPGQTIESGVTAVKNPTLITEQFNANPFEFGGELYGQGVGLKLAGTPFIKAKEAFVSKTEPRTIAGGDSATTTFQFEKPRITDVGGTPTQYTGLDISKGDSIVKVGDKFFKVTYSAKGTSLALSDVDTLLKQDALFKVQGYKYNAEGDRILDLNSKTITAQSAGTLSAEKEPARATIFTRIGKDLQIASLDIMQDAKGIVNSKGVIFSEQFKNKLFSFEKSKVSVAADKFYTAEQYLKLLQKEKGLEYAKSPYIRSINGKEPMGVTYSAEGVPVRIVINEKLTTPYFLSGVAKLKGSEINTLYGGAKIFPEDVVVKVKSSTEGVLAHELSHAEDYYRLGIKGTADTIATERKAFLQEGITRGFTVPGVKEKVVYSFGILDKTKEFVSSRLFSSRAGVVAEVEGKLPTGEPYSQKFIQTKSLEADVRPFSQALKDDVKGFNENRGGATKLISKTSSANPAPLMLKSLSETAAKNVFVEGEVALTKRMTANVERGISPVTLGIFVDTKKSSANIEQPTLINKSGEKINPSQSIIPVIKSDNAQGIRPIIVQLPSSRNGQGQHHHSTQMPNLDLNQDENQIIIPDVNVGQTQDQAQQQAQFYGIASMNDMRSSMKADTFGMPKDFGLLPYSKQEKKKTKGGYFDVFIRRKGKFAKQGRRESLIDAVTLGEDISKKTLARSFKISYADTGEPVRNIMPGFGFRQSKRDSGVIVQRAENSLASAGERMELRLSRRWKYKGFL